MRTIEQIEISLTYLNFQVEQEKTALRTAKAAQRKNKKSALMFSDDDKTGWMGGDTLPGGDGVYQRDMSSTDERCEMQFSYCDGSNWYIGGATPEQATATLTLSKHQDLPWRGLMAEPAAK